MTQQDLFDGPLTESDLLRQEIKAVKDRCDNTRRGLFQRYNALSKLVVELSEEVYMMRFRLGQIDDDKSYMPKDDLPDLFERDNEKDRENTYESVSI